MLTVIDVNAFDIKSSYVSNFLKIRVIRIHNFRKQILEVFLLNFTPNVILVHIPPLLFY